MTMNEKPFGIDVSRYQGQIDWDAVASHVPRIHFAGIRASINTGYTDTWFARNWEEAKRVGVARTAYHIFFPGTPAEQQVNHFLRVIGDDFGELPLTLDMELDHGIHYQRIAERILQFSTLIESRTGRKPILYSRTNWVNEHVIGNSTPPTWLAEHDWWVALYGIGEDEHPGPVTLPRGVPVSRFKIHQTTNQGKPIGVESKQMNYDRWQGDLNSFEAYLKGIVPERALTLEERVRKLEEIARSHGWKL